MKYKRLYLSSLSTLIGLFAILLMIGLQITSPDGDFVCTGDYRTQSECSDLDLVFGRECGPCTSKVNIYNPTPKNIFIYNKNEFDIDFSPEISDSAFYVKDGRCSGKLTGSSCSCYLNDGTEYAIKGWRCIDFTNRTKPRQDRIYVFRWSSYTLKNHLLVGFKENPVDEIKWTISTKEATLDPTWKGTNKKEKFDITRLTDCINEIITTEKTIPNYVEETYEEELCKTVSSPKCNTIFNKSIGKDVEVCSLVYKRECEIVTKTKQVQKGYKTITETKTICDQKGIVYYDGTDLLNDKDFFCKINYDEEVVECDSKLDGNGDGTCQRTGGESCYIYSFKSNGEYYLRKSNSEVYKKPTNSEETNSFKEAKKIK